MHCNIIGVSWESKKKRLSYTKKYIEELVWSTSRFWLHACLLMSSFLSLFLPAPVIRRKKICFFPENGGEGMAHPVTPVSTALLGKTIILDYSYYGLFSSLSDL